MRGFGLSGTVPFGRSGTECSDYQEPDRLATRRISAANQAPSNNPNIESFGLLLTHRSTVDDFRCAMFCELAPSFTNQPASRLRRAGRPATMSGFLLRTMSAIPAVSRGGACLCGSVHLHSAGRKEEVACKASIFTNFRVPSPSVPQPRDDLTHVELTWIAKQFEHWVRFGRITHDRIVSRRTRIASFRPDAIFAFVRWAANEHGTIASQIDIVRAVSAGEAYTTLPFVSPGGEILLSIHGWPKVEQVLRAIDAVEALGIDPCDAAPDHWRHVHNRLTVGHRPRAYTLARHRAWLLRAGVPA